MPTILIKRGTRAQLDAAAAASQLHVGEPYLVTDEGRLAVGTAVDAYKTAALESRITDGGRYLDRGLTWPTS